MMLFIDTSSFDVVHFAVIGEDRVVEKNVRIAHNESHLTAGMLQKFLRSIPEFRKSGFSIFKKIVVVSGPGSFTGIRVGIAIALGISLAAGVPLFAIGKDSIPAKLSYLPRARLKKVSAKFEPEYGAAPNITAQTKNPRRHKRGK